MADAVTQIGEYKLRKVLNKNPGQHSQVYEVIEPRSNRHFAMKILLPEFCADKEQRQMLFYEAEIGMRMRHENVINVIKVDKSATNPHFIMEYFPAGSLRDRLLSKDPTEKEFIKQNAKKIFKQIATGLAYMNSSGIIHCDMKPDNVLVNASVQAKIIDFAIAKKIKSGFISKLFHRAGKPQGTPSFMSPEQISGEMLDGRSDIYNYGATLYELTTGRPPFRAPSINELLKKHLVEKPASPVAFNSDVTDEFANLVLKTLAKKREQRHENFHELMMELKKIRVFKSVVDPDEDENQM